MQLVQQQVLLEVQPLEAQVVEEILGEELLPEIVRELGDVNHEDS
jgi:hypothetical protein